MALFVRHSLCTVILGRCEQDVHQALFSLCMRTHQGRQSRKPSLLLKYPRGQAWGDLRERRGAASEGQRVVQRALIELWAGATLAIT